MIKRLSFTFIIISFAFFSFLFSLSKGSTSISLYQLLFADLSQFQTIIMQLRLSRTLTAFTSGGLLALSGTLMQLLLQNPLADPYALGISGGAALFTLIFMLLGVNSLWLLTGAWLGSLLTMLLIVLLSKIHRWQSHTLLLSGIALAGAFSAGISFILLITPTDHLPSMLFWLAGDLNNTEFPFYSILVLIVSFLICLIIAPTLNLLGHGEKEALSLGVAVKKYRIFLYLLSSLLTATAVMLAGCIGFIGLIIPHITRQLVGYNHRIMLPIALLLGGSLLTLADTAARTLFTPEQLPAGLFIAIIGTPVFIGLLRK